MTCDRYWRDGVLLAERGEPDPHLATCLECRRAHEGREELLQALPLVAAEPGPPHWEARVWRAIAQESPRRVPRWWGVTGAVAAACTLIAVWCSLERDD